MNRQQQQHPQVPMYGQVVVGPPGSGKTTYCNGMQQYLRLIGRETVVVNLDPANEYLNDHQNDNKNKDNKNNTSKEGGEEEFLPYDVLLDTSEEIINLSSVMEELQLGPNGGLIYCLEYIHHHITTFISILQSKLQSYQKEKNLPHPPYILFDLPGQVELYTHSNTVQSIIEKLVKAFDLRLVMVQLIDAHHCMDVHKFISSALLSTTAMLRLELPAVNVLSKIDLLQTYQGNSLPSTDDEGAGAGQGEDGNDLSMPFNLDFFLECQELDRLLPYLNDTTSASAAVTIEQQTVLDNDKEYQHARYKRHQNKFARKHYKLHQELCDVINDFSLLNYIPLNINDAESVGRVVVRIDKCNGYIFTNGSTTRSNSSGGDNAKNKKGSNNEYGNNVEDMFQCAMQADRDWGFDQIADIQERYMGLYQDQLPELIRKDK